MKLKNTSFMLQDLVHRLSRSMETPVTEMEKTARGTNLGGKTGNSVLDGFSWLCVTL